MTPEQALAAALQTIYIERDLFGGNLSLIERAVGQDVPDLLAALEGRAGGRIAGDDYERQEPCPHCEAEFPEDVAGGCAASKWQSTGLCPSEDCTCYGTVIDGGLCEACYLLTK